MSAIVAPNVGGSTEGSYTTKDQLERFDKEKRKVMGCSCFSALIIAIVVLILLALVAAFALITQLKSDIETVLSCNGISGQWRRVAYLNTNRTYIECPGSLQATTNPPSCRISGSSPTCSSVFFSSGGLPYSQVCGRIHGRYSGSPGAFNNFTIHRSHFRTTIDGNYVDGVSLSYGMSPEKLCLDICSHNTSSE